MKDAGSVSSHIKESGKWAREGGMFEGRRSLVEERPVQRQTHAEEPGGSHEIIISKSKLLADRRRHPVRPGGGGGSRALLALLRLLHFFVLRRPGDGWLVLHLDGLAQEIPAGHDGSRRKTCPEHRVQTVPRFRRGTVGRHHRADLAARRIMAGQPVLRPIKRPQMEKEIRERFCSGLTADYLPVQERRSRGTGSHWWNGVDFAKEQRLTKCAHVTTLPISPCPPRPSPPASGVLP